MASNRALELADGKPCLIKKPKSDKVTTRALEEIATGMVECLEVSSDDRPRAENQDDVEPSDVEQDDEDSEET